VVNGSLRTNFVIKLLITRLLPPRRSMDASRHKTSPEYGTDRIQGSLPPAPAQRYGLRNEQLQGEDFAQDIGWILLSSSMLK
jgi:hypothetical protein